jgi:hypothetical protein
VGISDSGLDHQVDLQIERKHGNNKQRREGTRKVNPMSASQLSHSTKCDVFGDKANRFSNPGGTEVRTTRSVIQSSFPTSQMASNGFRWDVKDNSYPFYRHKLSAEDKQRLAFTATAVI